MKVIKNNSKPIRVVCIECNSELEVNSGELAEKWVTRRNGDYKYKCISMCPCCKTQGAVVINKQSYE